MLACKHQKLKCDYWLAALLQWKDPDLDLEVQDVEDNPSRRSSERLAKLTIEWFNKLDNKKLSKPIVDQTI